MNFDEKVYYYTQQLADTLIRKNHDYNNSYEKSVEKYGKTVPLIRISDKFNRLENLILSDKEAQVKESIEDTLLDLAGYCLLELVRRLNEKEDKQL